MVSSNLLSDELRFRSFGKETSPLARALIEDKNHNIWIGSETDITLFDVHDQTFESFGETFSIALLIIVNVFRLQTGKGIS